MNFKAKRISLITAAAIVMLAVILCVCACKPAVINKNYYVYNYDIAASDTGRQIAQMYEGVSVTIRAECKYRKRGILLNNTYTKSYEAISGTIISSDGLVLTALHGVRGGLSDSDPLSEVYTYTIYHCVNDGEGEQMRAYTAEYVDSRPSEDIALLKIKNAHDLAFADLSQYENASNGEMSYIFYNRLSYDNKGKLRAPQMMASANIGATDVSNESYSSCLVEAYTDAIYHKHNINIVTGELPSCAMGGLIVNEKGKITGMAFSRILNAAESAGQSSHIYGLIAATTVEAIRNLYLTNVNGGNNE